MTSFASVVSVLSADRQDSGCETELVEGGDELADIDDGVIMRIHRDSLPRPIDVRGVEPFEGAASARLNRQFQPFFKRYLAQVTTQMGDVRFQPHARNTTELDACSDETGVAQGAVQSDKVHPRDILVLDLNPYGIREIIERLFVLVARHERAFVQLHLVDPGQWLKRCLHIVEATAAAEVIHSEEDGGSRNPDGAAETRTLDPKQQ